MRSRPISAVVTDAFEQSPATSKVDPELVKLIRAEVMEQMMKAMPQPLSSPTLAAPVPSQGSQTVYPPPQSPSPNSENARQVFTPPSPEPFVATGGDRGFSSPSPDNAPSDSGSQFSRYSRSSIGSREEVRRNMPRPGKNDSESTIRNQSPASPDRRRSRREGAFDRSSKDADRLRRDSKTSDAAYDGGRSRSRVPAQDEPINESVDTGETVIEKMWKPLFVDGKPTDRLNQFLRGLALHLIDDYEPVYSLVVTPAKMLRFLNETKVDQELYPWDIIFGGKMALASLSVMYRRLVCEHHLVQGNHQEYPNIPGLTPNGFARFMTCLIQAYPNTEYERLATAVMNMPIANADDKKERFPKELSRRLLPAESNIEAEQRLVSSLNHEPYVLAEVKSTTAVPPPPPPAPAQSAPPAQSAGPRGHGQSFSERARGPYVQTTQHSSAVDEEELGSPTSRPPIERERKPYYAREGTGRMYEGDEGRSPQAQYRPEQSNVRPKRSDSGLPPQAMYAQNGGQTEPVDIPQPPRMPHRQSFGQANMLNMIPPSMGNTYSRSRDARRPSPTRNLFARSGTDLSEAGSAANQPSNLHPVQSDPAGWDSGDEKYARYAPPRPRNDRAPSSAFNNEDTRSEREFNRGGPNTNMYDRPDHRSMGGPVGDPLIGRSYQERPMQPPPPSTDDGRRRRSDFDPPGGYQGGGDGGTDGYGSFANGKYSQQPYASSQRD